MFPIIRIFKINYNCSLKGLLNMSFVPNKINIVKFSNFRFTNYFSTLKGPLLNMLVPSSPSLRIFASIFAAKTA